MLTLLHSERPKLYAYSFGLSECNKVKCVKILSQFLAVTIYNFDFLYSKLTLNVSKIKLSEYIFRGSNSVRFLSAYLLNRDLLMQGRICSTSSKFFLFRPDE